MNTASKLIVPAMAFALAILSSPATAQPAPLRAASAGVDALAAGALVEVQHQRDRRGRKAYPQRYRGDRVYAPTYAAPPREQGYRTSTGQWYPYCVVDLGYGRVEACGGSTPP